MNSLLRAKAHSNHRAFGRHLSPILASMGHYRDFYFQTIIEKIIYHFHNHNKAKHVINIY